MIRVAPYTIAQVQHPYYEQCKEDHPNCVAAQEGWHPYIHQAVLFDTWHKHNAFLLTTKTGSGKTQAAALPVIANSESAFFLYPTNALVKDQQYSILKLAEGLGKKAYVYQAGTDFDKRAFNQADIILLRVDADNLEYLRKQGFFRTKGQTLVDVLNLGKPTIVLTNPDTLFLILALRYGNAMAVFKSLQQYQSLVIDEFHLYGGVELAHILFMLYYCRAQNFFTSRIVLLSATPDTTIAELLDQIIAPFHIGHADTTTRPQVGTRRVAHPVDLHVIAPGSDPVRTALAHFAKLRPELEQRFQNRDTDDYVPLVLIFNSVMAAMYAADLLREEYHVSPEQVGEYRGLMNRRLRSFKGKLVVVGTSAIEVGVDFKCRYLIFEAGDAAGFMQRFGRVGRHEAGTAYLLAPPNVRYDAANLTEELGRDKLEDKVYLWYARNDARPWFARTESGLYTIALLAHRLVKNLAADRAVTSETIQNTKTNTAELLQSYAAQIKAEAACQKISKRLQLYHRNPDAPMWAWLKAYAGQISFRTSSVNFRVHDVREEQRPSRDTVQRGWYDADLRTLLRRGKNPALKQDRNGEPYVSIQGYTQPTRVRADVEVGKLGTLYSTHAMRDKYKQRVLLTREGKTSKLSDAMMQQDHVFVIVPDSVQAAVDWRIPTYYHPQGLLAFDGAALLLKEIYEREKNSSG
jgi:CRISPR-associated endonuclease/helicase Cas3